MELTRNYKYSDGTSPEHFVRDNRNYEVPANVLAGKWITTTSNMLSFRQQQFRDLGLTEEEIEERLDNHIAYLDMLKKNFDNDNENFIDFLSQLEKAALEHSENDANYALNHTSQLDTLVQQAIEMQESLATHQDHSLQQ